MFFIDSGEIQDVTNTNFNMYSISDRAQRLSARAIPCDVVGVALSLSLSLEFLPFCILIINYRCLPILDDR